MAAEILLERHPFAPFIPEPCSYLLIGTFPGWQSTKADAPAVPEIWYYGTHTHSLWHLLEQVFDRPLNTIVAQKALLTSLHMGITDVVAAARRRKPNGSRDADLYDQEFQTDTLRGLLENPQLKKLYFTSKQAQKWFNEALPDAAAALPQLALPSPSPLYIQYGHGTEADRLHAYRHELLPLLEPLK